MNRDDKDELQRRMRAISHAVAETRQAFRPPTPANDQPIIGEALKSKQVLPALGG